MQTFSVSSHKFEIIVFFVAFLPSFLVMNSHYDAWNERYSYDATGLISGDQPHYLVATSTMIRHQSIYVDDFFLDDIPDPNLKWPNDKYGNYEKNCHPTQWHGYKTSDNKCAPHHYLGLSFLLIQGYFWGGLFGALTSMIVISTFTAVILFRFVRKITNVKISFVATLLVIFGTILFSFSDSIYPELVAGLILISVFSICFSERISSFRYLALGMLVGILPFFKFSFIIPAVVIILFLVIFSLKDRQYRRTISVTLPFLIILGIFFYHVALIYEDTSQGPGGHLDKRVTSLLDNVWGESGNFLDRLIKGLISNLFSRNYGLLIFSPLLFLSIFGTKQIWSINKRIALLSYAVVVTFIIAQSYSSPFAAGWSIPSRYLIILIPIMGIWLAALLQKYYSNLIFLGILIPSVAVGFIFNYKFAQFIDAHTRPGQRQEIMLEVYHGFGEIFPFYGSSRWPTTSPIFWDRISEFFWVFLLCYVCAFIAYLLLPSILNRIRNPIH